MKISKVILLVVAIVLLALPYALCQEDSGSGSAGPAAETEAAEGVAVSGTLLSPEDCPIALEECVVCLEDGGGSFFCIREGEAANELEELVGTETQVKVMGTFEQSQGERYLDVEEFEIIEEAQPKGSTYEEEGSTQQQKDSGPKGSY